MTVSFFPVVIFSGHNWCSYLTRTPIMVLTTGKITTGKKGTVVWLAMFFGGLKLQPEKITTGKKNRSQNNPPENNVVPVPPKILWELAPYYFLADCFEKQKLILKQSAGK